MTQHWILHPDNPQPRLIQQVADALADIINILGVADGTGYTVYANSLLIMMVPHAIVTVSLIDSRTLRMLTPVAYVVPYVLRRPTGPVRLPKPSTRASMCRHAGM